MSILSEEEEVQSWGKVTEELDDIESGLEGKISLQSIAIDITNSSGVKVTNTLYVPKTPLVKMYFLALIQISKIIVMSLIPTKADDGTVSGFTLNTEKLLEVMEDNEMPPYR